MAMIPNPTDQVGYAYFASACGLAQPGLTKRIKRIWDQTGLKRAATPQRSEKAKTAMPMAGPVSRKRLRIRRSFTDPEISP